MLWGSPVIPQKVLQGGFGGLQVSYYLCIEILHTMTDMLIYTDLASLIELYRNNDLPQDQMAFPYRQPSGTTAWVHRDELRKQLALQGAYPQANTQKGK